VLPGYQDTSVEAPREKLLFDIGWKFQFGHGSDPARDLDLGRAGRLCQDRDFEFSKAKFDDSKWRPLNLPHDWAVELPFVRDEELNSHGYKPLGRRYPETSVGWYRREFEIPATDLGAGSAWIRRAFRDVLVFVNGCFIGGITTDTRRSASTLRISLPTEQRTTLLRALTRASGRMVLRGAGIYRHMWLSKTDALHLGLWRVGCDEG